MNLNSMAEVSLSTAIERGGKRRKTAKNKFSFLVCCFDYIRHHKSLYSVLRKVSWRICLLNPVFSSNSCVRCIQCVCMRAACMPQIYRHTCQFVAKVAIIMIHGAVVRRRQRLKCKQWNACYVEDVTQLTLHKVNIAATTTPPPPPTTTTNMTANCQLNVTKVIDTDIFSDWKFQWKSEYTSRNTTREKNVNP